MDKEIIEVSVDDIVPNRFQPRLNFDEKELKNLAESIKAHGIIQPLVLRRLGDKFEIIAGERRYKASIMAGLTKVPAILKDIDDNKSAELAVIENVQRKNLSSLEEALSYQKILSQGNVTQEDLANRMGIAQSTLANKLRLLNLSEEAQEALLKNQISERHARSLLSLKDEKQQIEMLKKIIGERLTVKQTDEEISKILGNVQNQVDTTEQPQPAPAFDINMLLKKQDNSVSAQPQEIPAFTHDITDNQPVETSQINSIEPTNEILNQEANVISQEPSTNFASFLEPQPTVSPEEPIIETNNPEPINNITPQFVNEEQILPEQNILEENTSVEIPNLTQVEQQAEIPTSPQFINDNNIQEESVNTFENITPNLDNIFSSINVEQELEDKPIIDEPLTSDFNMNQPEFISEDMQDSDTSFKPLGYNKHKKEIPSNVDEPEILELDDTSNNATDINMEDTTAEFVDTEEDAEDYFEEDRSLNGIINKTRNLIEEMKQDGYEVDSEEIDFNDEYQIIIKIKKEDEEE